MADDVYSSSGNPRVGAKGRSLSICAPGSSSMETLVQNQNSVPNSGMATPTKQDSGTPVAGRRRGKPAARSQSARIASGRSIRRKTTTTEQQSNNNYQETNKPIHKRDGAHYNSEPRLTETPEPSPGIRRRGSRRGVSVYHHRKSTAFLEIPNNSNLTQGGSRSDDGSGEPDEEGSYRMRSFSSTSKGIVNRGDSFRRRRSRSSSLCPGHHGLPSGGIDRETPPRSPGGIRNTIVTEEDGNCISPGSNGNIHNKTLCDNDVSKSYRVALIGASGVGKTALISQFMTSECINAYEGKEITEEPTVSIMLNGEESELHFINIQALKDIDKSSPPDAFVVLYSVVDRASYTRAEADLRTLHDNGLLRGKPVLIAANKIDLARSRAVTAQDGKCLACTYKGKFIEISVGINHNCDELLVGILNQIRLKEAQPFSSHGTVTSNQSSQQWYKSRGVVRASMKARQMFTWIFGKEDSKFKNCENLHIL